ncbi:unnamed protein product [Zymoseptoria tritici ST99CH_1A5]|uniref:F-box domain-containing protein n=1 Tax=Zymoseptoria tritici ST99CH_1A5 TaxID=1276529 RepID=A0A1Y6M263_ZYMTR|nr:unnamed protein product [Zymoseptoria tritici ST99CH_1A5]
MRQRATLPGLPVELIERIAQLTSQEDRKCLRMVSRDCGAKVLNVYKDSVFHEVRVMLCSESSIRNAINIIAHQLYGTAVKNFILTDISEPDPADYHFAHAYGKSIAVAAHQAQKRRREYGNDRKLLTELFDKCRENGRMPSIHFKSHRDGKWLQHAVCRTNWSNADVTKNKEPDSDDYCLTTVMLAIVSSGASVDTFSMDVAAGQGIHLGRNERDMHKGTVYVAALYHFKALDLVLNVCEQDQEDSHQFARDFITKIAKLNVRSLKIIPVSRYEWHLDLSPVAALMKLEFPLLESLDFEYVSVDWKILIAFCKRHKKLRQLALPGSLVTGTPDGIDAGYVLCAEIEFLTGVAEVMPARPYGSWKTYNSVRSLPSRYDGLLWADRRTSRAPARNVG